MTINTQDLSIAEMEALLKDLRERKAAVKSAAAAVLGGLLTEYVETVVGEREPSYSEGSAWVGFSDNGIPVTIDGVEYSVSITTTHVAEKARRLPTYTAANEVANERKLNGDDRKTFLKAAMASTLEPVEA